MPFYDTQKCYIQESILNLYAIILPAFGTEPISISYVVNIILNFTIPIGLFSFVIKLSCHVST